MRKKLFSLALLLLAGFSLVLGQTTNKCSPKGSKQNYRKDAKSITIFPIVSPSGDTLYYKINSDSMTVSLTAPLHGISNWYIDWYGSHIRPSGHLVIPSSVTIDSVVYTVTKIDTAAFFNCHITGVSIPNTITFIGRSAFGQDSLITSVYIPQSVTQIQEFAFFSTALLDTIVVDTGNTVFDSRYNCNAIIETATNTLIKGCNTTIIPSSVTALGDFSLSYMSFTEMIIPNTIVSIGKQTFYECRQLASITISESVTSIGNWAFEYDSNLTSITLLNPSLSNVSNSAFNYTTLDSVTLTVPCGRTSYYSSLYPWSRCRNVVEQPDCGRPYYDFCAVSSGGTLYYKILDSSRVMVVHPLEFDSIGNSYWTGYAQPTGMLFIPDRVVYNNNVYHVTKVGEEAFMNCLSITSVIISNSVDTIERKAFAFDFMIDEISWGVSLLYMGDSALFGCGRVEVIIVIPPDYTGPTPSVTAWVGRGAFGGCNFGSFTYGGSSISSGTYSGNSYLNYFYYSGIILTIDDYAFEGCEGLSVFTWIAGIPEIRIPRTIQSIGNAAFGNCIAITRVCYEADSCTYMGNDSLPVFMNDINISSLTIGEHVRWIPSYAFLGCFGLDTIWSYSMEAPMLGVDVFRDIPANIPVYIPCGSLASYTSRWPHFTNFIELYDGALSVSSANILMGSANVIVSPSCGVNGEIAAVPSYGYHFTCWSDSDTNNPRSIAVADGDSVYMTAFFERNEYELVVLSDSVQGAVAGAGTYLYEDTATVAATANYGYHFTMWSDSVTANPRTIVVTRDTLLTALFDRNPYVVTTQCDSVFGAVSGAGTYLYEDTAMVTVTANYGYHFTMWSDGVTDNPRSVIVVCDTVLTALFERNEYTLAVVCDETQGVVTGAGVYLYGDTASVTVVANEGFVFDRWEETGDTLTAIEVVMNSDVTLTALFDTIYYSLTLGSNNPEWGSVRGGGEYAYGTEVEFTATANDGYRFVQWSDGVTENPRVVVVVEDIELTAEFEESVGIKTVDGMNVTMYPNPTTGLLNIEGEGVVRVEVYDLGGRRVMSVEHVRSIDMSALPSGVYYVRVALADGVAVEKVVKK